MMMQLTMDQYRVPGLAVAIVEDGKIVFAKGYGVTELASGAPVTPGTAFNAGALSTQFTAAAVMQLVEQGKIDLATPLAEYLPAFTMADARFREITVGQLLTHTSGLANPEGVDWSQPLQDMWQGFDQETDPGGLTRYLERFAGRQLLAAPGAKWSYADANYNLLGAVIEAVSGQSFEAYMHDHIFAPLGMAHTTYVPAALDPPSWPSHTCATPSTCRSRPLSTPTTHPGPLASGWSQAPATWRAGWWPAFGAAN